MSNVQWIVQVFVIPGLLALAGILIGVLAIDVAKYQDEQHERRR